VCWGYSTDGDFGNGSLTATTYAMPQPVPGITNAVELSLGLTDTCARLATGVVECWGDNHAGVVGDGTIMDRSMPTPVGGITDAVEISVGWFDACARRASGGVVCWGASVSDGHVIPTPMAVAGLTDAVALASGASLGCAIRAGGTVACWGSNAYGACGNGSSLSNEPSPVMVTGITDATSIAADNDTACVTRSSGVISCWGGNLHGGLGDGTRMSRSTPVNVMGIAGATAVGVGTFSTCALLGHAVECWGDNEEGESGGPTATDVLAPNTVIAF
jgi:alpha-tubulin suppressor-like RCC1 family protein